MNISSKTDIEAYVGSEHPDFVEHGLAEALTEAIRDADHPDYGRDWSEWLAENIEQMRDSVSAQNPS